MEKRIEDVNSFETKVKIVVYGKPGTGKTTFASTFPKPILLVDCGEKGTESVRDVEDLRVLRAESWEDLELIYWYLKDNPDDVKTVVIDTLSYAQDLIIRQIMEEEGKEVEDGKLGGWGTMTKKMWGEVASRMKQFVTNLRDLEDLNVVFIAHDRVFNAEDDDESADSITPSVGPRLMPSVASATNAAVGIIGNTFIRENVKKEKGKREVIKYQYCLRVGPHAYFITKVRKPKGVKLPDVLIDPEYEDILDIVNGD